MLTFAPGTRVFVATSRIDGRKGIDGLSVLVRSQFAEGNRSRGVVAKVPYVTTGDHT